MPRSADKITTSLRSHWLALSWPALGGLLMVVALALPALAEPRVILKGHTLALADVAYSADGRYVATGSYDRTAKVWEATGKLLVTLAGHGATVEAVAFSPDGKFLATGSYDGTVKLWDWAAGKELATFAGHSSMIRALAYSPDGKTVASGSHDNAIKLWDVASGRERTQLRHTGAVSRWPSAMTPRCWPREATT